VIAALVTAKVAREHDEDLVPLAEALRARDADVEICDWDDAAVDWSAIDLAVIRSTWDYTARRDAFLSWADEVTALTRLENPAAVLRWNTDKRYLRDLEQAGVPTVPTVFVEPGERPTLPPIEVVVKPSVSAGARDTARYRPSERAEARAHTEALLAEGRTVMIQPYLDAVDDHGETALVHVGGVFSHAFRKGPILVPGSVFVDGLYVEERISEREPTDAEREVAQSALDAARRLTGEDLLYARVDLLPGPDGSPVVLELELTEPSLFHAISPGSVERFADAITARC
jgi:O-ureido-D-serine cyclo-ligase